MVLLSDTAMNEHGMVCAVLFGNFFSIFCFLVKGLQMGFLDVCSGWMYGWMFLASLANFCTTFFRSCG